MSLTLHPHILFCFSERLTFCSSPQGLLSNSSALQSPLVSRHCGYCSSSSLSPPRSCLHHHPGTLIYKLAAKPRPNPPPSPFSSSCRRQSGRKIALERQEERAMYQDIICQPKEDGTKNLNVSEQLARICLPLPEAGRKLVYLSERQGGASGGAIRLK